ncbi:hypothetical protein HN51_015691 [Arachis hypogaea]
MALWNMIVHAHTRSVSKRLFSRMVTLYDHHHFPEKMIEIFCRHGGVAEQKLGKKKVHLKVEIGVFQIVNDQYTTTFYYLGSAVVANYIVTFLKLLY